jgi:hypothetical protein
VTDEDEVTGDAGRRPADPVELPPLAEPPEERDSPLWGLFALAAVAGVVGTAIAGGLMLLFAR